MAKSKSCNGGALVDGGIIDTGIGLGVGYGVSWVLQKLMFRDQSKALVGSAQGGIGAGMAFLGAQVGFPVVGIAAGAAAAAKGIDNIVTVLAEAHKANAPSASAGSLNGPADRSGPVIVRDVEGKEYAYIKGANTETLVSRMTGDTVAVNTQNQKTFEIGTDGIARQVGQPAAALSGPEDFESGPQDVVAVTM